MASNPTYDILQQPDSIDFKKYIRRILKNWYWFVISISIAFGVAWFLNRYTPPVYTVHTTLLISGSSRSVQGIESLIAELGFFRRQQQSDILTEIEVLKSYQLSYETLQELPEFRHSYYGVGDFKATNIYTNCPFRVVEDSLTKNRANYPVNITIIDENRYVLDINDTYGIQREMTFGEWFTHPDFNFKLEYRNPQSASSFSADKKGQLRNY
ncbi:MAG: Wzz/FepE/Etk N-terminal domain-containing protein, partial [Bacteroidota bacterium]